jgi:hypothetical protein
MRMMSSPREKPYLSGLELVQVGPGERKGLPPVDPLLDLPVDGDVAREPREGVDLHDPLRAQDAEVDPPQNLFLQGFSPDVILEEQGVPVRKGRLVAQHGQHREVAEHGVFLELAQRTDGRRVSRVHFQDDEVRRARAADEAHGRLDAVEEDDLAALPDLIFHGAREHQVPGDDDHCLHRYTFFRSGCLSPPGGKNHPHLNPLPSRERKIKEVICLRS